MNQAPSERLVSSFRSAALESAVRAACLLEATARKPGNVHPLAAFADCRWEDFAASADAIALPLAEASMRPLGETILLAVEATNRRVGRNTNLGMILLLAPLAAVPPDLELRGGIGSVLKNTTTDDCRLVYEAIRLARPGGLGTADREDVAAPPSVTLAEAMRLAADRDDVARQYSTGFADVFRLADRFDAADLPALERQIVAAHVARLAERPDTLILRKCGPAVAAEASRLAAAAERDDVRRLEELDAFLRADGNRRNPGTTADLLAAALFVALREGRLPPFADSEIVAYAAALRSAASCPTTERRPSGSG